jgi:hypothetical protein
VNESERIGEILPSVMQDIARRTELNRPEHKAGVLAAIKSYFKQHRTKRTKKGVILR